MPPRNPYICITIIGILGLVALSGMAGVIVLSLYAKQAPGELIALAGSAVGALSSFLVQVPRGSMGAAGGQQQIP